MKQIPLTNRTGCFSLVDDEDFEELAKHRWWVHSEGYAMRKAHIARKQVTILMHRQIIGTPAGLQTDHINGNRLDNRRSNLRLATARENQLNVGCKKNNSLKLKGISFRKGKYVAVIKPPEGKSIIIGRFKTAEIAYAAYCKAAKQIQGEFYPSFLCPSQSTLLGALGDSHFP